MSIISANSIRVLEADGRNEWNQLRVFLDEPAPWNVPVYFITYDRSATSGDFRPDASTVVIRAGETHADINLSIGPDDLREGDEEFEVLIYTGHGPYLEENNFIPEPAAFFDGGAPGLMATVTIMDDDDDKADLAPGPTGPAIPLPRPEPENNADLTVAVHGFSVIEGDPNERKSAYFLLTLDKPTTEEISIPYKILPSTATDGVDFSSPRNAAGFLPGQQTKRIGVTILGDDVVEGNEFLQIFLGEPQAETLNVKLVGGGPFHAATATIIDDDAGLPVAPGGLRELGTKYGSRPERIEELPTLRIYGTKIIEGDGGSYKSITLAYTFDSPISESVTLQYEIQPGTATFAEGDYGRFPSDLSGLTRLHSGSGWIEFSSPTVAGDQIAEGDESFTVLFSAYSPGTPPGFRFEGGASALEAQITILDDEGALSGSAGIGDVASQSPAPGDDKEPPIGTAGDDFLVGDEELNLLEGFGGNDTLIGGQGHDTLEGGSGSDTLNGGAGDDSILAGDGDNLVLAGDGNDYLSAFGGHDEIYGGPGNDTLFAGAGNDSVGGAAGADQIGGGSGNDELWGGGGNDTIYGGAGSDTIGAGSEHDEVGGGDGNDTVWAGSGNDSVYGNDGDDELTAGNGADLVYAGTGNDTIFGGDGNDTLGGVVGNDEIWAGAGNDEVYGWTGNDTLLGLAGNDDLWGGNGRDTLNGGAGNDTLRGGADADTLVFSLGVDRAIGFGPGDVVDLSTVAAITGFADLTANHLSGAVDAVIDDGLGNTLTLVGVGMGTLDAGDFAF